MMSFTRFDGLQKARIALLFLKFGITVETHNSTKCWLLSKNKCAEMSMMRARI